MRPSAEMVSGYSVVRNSRNSSSTKGMKAFASPSGRPMKPSIDTATKYVSFRKWVSFRR